MYLILGYMSALAMACTNGNLDMVSYLISKGVDMEAKGLPECYTPLSLARNHREILELLRNAGAVRTDPRYDSNIRRQNMCTLL